MTGHALKQGESKQIRRSKVMLFKYVCLIHGNLGYTYSTNYGWWPVRVHVATHGSEKPATATLQFAATCVV